MKAAHLTRSPAALGARLGATVERLLGARETIGASRRANLNLLAGFLVRDLIAKGRAEVVFVCTHNSRRSIFSQAWLTAAAAHFGLPIAAFSGGSEASHVAAGALRALEALGFAPTSVAGSDPANPIWELQYLAHGPSLRVWSKRYDDRPNPAADFVAVVNCPQADEGCPTIEGARTRLAMLYVDPKLADGKPDETEVYLARAEQIGCEILSLVASCAELLPR